MTKSSSREATQRGISDELAQNVFDNKIAKVQNFIPLHWGETRCTFSPLFLKGSTNFILIIRTLSLKNLRA